MHVTMATTSASGRREKRRGRPSKYGRPGQVVAVTLPHEVIGALRKVHSDLGWAIVALVDKVRSTAKPADAPAEAELVKMGAGVCLIVVNPAILRGLPGVQMIPLSGTQAFLALEPGRGMADLEIAVLDRLESLPPGGREQQAMLRFRDRLRRWRRDSHWDFQGRSIILASPRSSGTKTR